MLHFVSRRVISPSSLRTMAIAAPAARALTTAAPGLRTPSDGLEKLHYPPSVVVRASVVSKEASGGVGLTAKRSLYSSGRAISGVKLGSETVFSSRQRPSYSIRIRPSFSSVRCEATVAEKEAPAVEKYEYQAEVTRLLDLIVHSLYSNKEVFLRELVSNASDALDKLRFLSVTEPELLEANSNLEIRVRCSAEDGTVTISDTGLGMTREELVKSLGTIAESGTAKFLKAMKESKEKPDGDNNLIGQFGVGFYSAFLVADKVTVSTKSAKSDRQYVWEGEADTSVYTIREETDSEKLIPRGTTITLYLKTDAKDEYTDPVRIQNLVKNYSQFISFPIYTYQEKTRTKEEKKEDKDKDAKEAASEELSEEDSVLEDGADTSSKDSSKKKKKATEKYWDWELTNETKPIWMRPAKEVTKEEYNAFFKKTFNEFMDPRAYTHFSTEGEIEFKSLLYTPGIVPLNTDDVLSQRTKNIKLYVKRVFISEDFDGELMPRYLGFVKGIVDSNDLPLNVSREILQESRIIRVMKKRLVRKVFDMIDEIAKREDKNDYKLFWTCFGKNLKLGCIEDSSSHKRIAPLLRYFSSKTAEDEFCTLDDYVKRMKGDQTSIYYLASDTVKSAKSAPFLEELMKRDLEVLFLVDPIDEVAITNLATYKEKKFVDITKEDLDLDSENKDKEKEVEQEFKLLCDWIKGFLGEKVAKVKISNRISSSPCVLVSGKFGWSANMERIMKAQTLGDNTQMEFMRGRRVLEINPEHPIIKDLNFACKETPRSPKARQLVELLFETAQLSSGFTPENPANFGGKVYEMMAMALAGQRAEATSHKDGAAVVEPDVANDSDIEAEAASESEIEAEVVEASEVRPESDPWKQ